MPSRDPRPARPAAGAEAAEGGGKVAARGRPRDPEIDRLVREAVLGLLADEGYARTTIDAVAARAGVKRPAIYRRFPNRAALVVDAVRGAFEGASPRAPETDDVRGDLETVLKSFIVALTRTRLGAVLRALVVERVHDAELGAMLHALERERRAVLRAVLRRASREGRLRRGVSEDFAIEAVLGPIYFRLFFTDAPPTPAMARPLAGLVLVAIAPPPSRGGERSGRPSG
jgi:AcrR family transcriptional regulator